MVVHAHQRSPAASPSEMQLGLCGVSCALCCAVNSADGVWRIQFTHSQGGEPTGSPIQQTPSGEFDLAGVESILQTRSGALSMTVARCRDVG